MIKIGCNFLSLQNTDVESFIEVAHDLRMDIVDFHYRAFTFDRSRISRQYQASMSQIRYAHWVYRCERFVRRECCGTRRTCTRL